jgi:hypothetical protein
MTALPKIGCNRYFIWSGFLGTLAIGVGAYFSIFKRNFNVGGGSLALASVCAIAYAYFNKHAKGRVLMLQTKFLALMQTLIPFFIAV